MKEHHAHRLGVSSSSLFTVVVIASLLMAAMYVLGRTSCSKISDSTISPSRSLTAEEDAQLTSMPGPAGEFSVRDDHGTRTGDGLEATNTVRILVVSRGGAPVEGCGILMRDELDSTRLGVTDPEGVLTVPRDSIAGAWIATRCSGHAQSDVLVPVEPPDRVVIQVGDEAVIEGLVVLLDGSLPAGPVEVVAHRIERLEEIRGPGLSYDQDPGIHRVSTRSDGSFVVAGLEPGHRYVVQAGSPGWVSYARVVATAPQDGLRLELAPVFVIRVRLRTESGRPFPPSESLSEEWGISFQVTDSEARVPVAPGLSLLMAGADPAELTSHPWEYLLIYTGVSDVETLRPVMARIAVPGYVERPLAVALPRFRGDVPVEEVVLSEESGSWTELTIRWQGGPRFENVYVSEHPALMRLDLRRFDGKRYSLPLWGHGGRGVERHVLPAGDYEWRLVVRGQGHLQAGGQGHASWHAEQEELMLQWPATHGALLLELTSDLGIPYRGHWKLFYRRARGAEKHYRTVVFSGSPALLSCLPVGEWELFPAPGMASPPGAGALSATTAVLPGELIRVRLVPPEKP